MAAPGLGRLALAPHAASSMFFPVCAVALMLREIQGLFLIEPLDFLFSLPLFFFFPVRCENCDLLVPTPWCHHLLSPWTPFFTVASQAAAASSLALTLLLLTEAHSTFRCLKKCPLVLLPTVLETVVSNKEQTMERKQIFFFVVNSNSQPH